MAKKYLIPVFALISFLILSGDSGAQNSIIVSLKTPLCPWIECRLGDKLDYYLSCLNRVSIAREDLPINPEFASFESLLSWGRQRGGRFLVDITVDRIDLERRKATVFPEIVFRYQVYAVLTGTLRIIDLKKGRLAALKDINQEVKAADQWQFVDDNENDPALSVPPDEKMVLFRRLEDKTALKLLQEVKELSRGNSFGR
jgi:hypothetical protein